jgi:hypothetical protein
LAFVQTNVGVPIVARDVAAISGPPVQRPNPAGSIQHGQYFGSGPGREQLTSGFKAFTERHQSNRKV